MAWFEKIYRIGMELSFQAGMFPPFQKQPDHFIIMYHGVTKDGNTRFNSRHEPVGYFEKHIRFLKKHFQIISLRDFFDQKFGKGKTNVAITFDDGYRNNFLYAKPILEKYEAPATFYVTGLNEVGSRFLWADFLNIVSYFNHEPVAIEDELYFNESGVYYSSESKKSLYEVIRKDKPNYSFKEKVYSAFKNFEFVFGDEMYFDYWQLMSDEEIEQCARSPFIEIGSHSYYHNNLGNIPLQNAVDEMSRSKKYLENIIQKEVTDIAYPDGSYSKDVKNAAEKIGFRIQLAADGFLFSDDKSDSRIKDRIGIYNAGRCGLQLLQPILKP